MSTVTVRLLGGLGNQMFQYAAGLALAERHGSKLRLDPSYIGFEAHRSYALDVLRVEAAVSRRRRVPMSVFERERLDRAIVRLRFFGARIEDEATHAYDEHFEHAPAGAYLIGYRQVERYILPVEALLREQFQPREMGSVAETWGERIAATPNSVAVHVRRGDYVENETTNRLFGVLEPDYYERAAAIVERAAGAGTFTYFVFSDDIAWCREQLRLPGETEFVSGATAAHEDLHLMRLCRHNVIANSSFSWWGAWLGETPDSVVVAPKVWFENYEGDTSETVPARWLRA